MGDYRWTVQLRAPVDVLPDHYLLLTQPWTSGRSPVDCLWLPEGQSPSAHQAAEPFRTLLHRDEGCWDVLWNRKFSFAIRLYQKIQRGHSPKTMDSLTEGPSPSAHQTAEP